MYCYARAFMQREQQSGRWRDLNLLMVSATFQFFATSQKSIIQFALLWGSTWVVASLAIASVLTMALIANLIVSSTEIGPRAEEEAHLLLIEPRTVI